MARVNQVVGDCPGCEGVQTFGNVLVRGNTLVRGCSNCDFKQRIALPPVQKKIIYLDQSLLSAAFKAGDARAVKAVELVTELACKQLLTAPHSNIHEDETHLWSGYGGKTPKELMRFIERTSIGVAFIDTHEVEKTQAIKGYKAFLEGRPPDYELDWRDAVSGSVHSWHNYDFVTTPYRGDAAAIARWKQEQAQQLVMRFDDWMKSKRTFEEDVAFETIDMGRHSLDRFADMLARTASGDVGAELNAPESAQRVRSLWRVLPETAPFEERFQKVARFFGSPHFASLPSEWLSARIIATLKAMVRAGSFADREKAIKTFAGFFFDLKHIATYAPYSDAIFVDNQLASWVANSKVGLTKCYGTRVFSMNTMDEFMSWLGDLEKSMADVHRDAANRAYAGMLSSDNE